MAPRSSNSKHFCCGDTQRAASKHARPAHQALAPGPVSLLRYMGWHEQLALTLICTHAHARIPRPTPPSHVHKPGRFPFVLVLRVSGSPLPWPLSSWVPLACFLPLLPLCPCCSLGEKRQPRRCDQRIPRGLSYGRRLGLQGWPPACALFVFP